MSVRAHELAASDGEALATVSALMVRLARGV
jgi:hypothetical protein